MSGDGILDRKLREQELRNRMIEERLLEKERHYEALMKAMPVGLFQTSADGMCTYVNDRVCQLFGLPPEELTGLNWLNGVCPGDRERVRHEWLHCVENKEAFNMEFLVRHSGGKDIWVIGKAAPYLGLNNEYEFAGTLSDISRIKQSYEELKIQRQRTLVLLDNLPLLIYIVDQHYTIRFTNRALRDRLNMDRSNLCYEVIKNRSEPCEECYPFNVFGGKSYEIWERTMEDRTFQVYAYPFDDGGEPLVFIMGIDISGYRKAKASLESFQKEMVRLERLHLIGEVAASLGHEVRNPVTTVRGFLQLLKEKVECAPYEEYFELMISELDRSDTLIQDFLSLAKTGTARREKRNLNELVEKLSPLIYLDSLNSGKSVVMDLSPTPDLLLDEKEIHQLIFNLARNGLEAMSNGGSLRIKTSQDREKVVLAVQDEGPGINPDILDKIGTPFVTTKEKGTGLGLAVCYGIAKRNDAEIKFETGSAGTTFYVTFNIAHHN